MKLKLDENLPESLLPALRALGHDADNVRSEGIEGQDDDVVWRAAQGEGRFLVTQDLDFSDLRQFAPGTHAGLLLVRLPAAGRQELARVLTELFRDPSVEAWQGCFAVLSPHKLRIHRPPPP
jgi:predicted nuclease of predicted toxin-antitoxin system